MLTQAAGEPADRPLSNVVQTNARLASRAQSVGKSEVCHETDDVWVCACCDGMGRCLGMSEAAARCDLQLSLPAGDYKAIVKK